MYLAQQNCLNFVYPFETRPYLQGSRLTSYELLKGGISHEVVVEGAMSHLLKNKKIDAVFIGADRIASNGDTANKIGSSSLSIVAHHYGVPFFVFAPTSSFDLTMESGDQIEIELRPENEVTEFLGQPIAAKGVKAFNPSFDVTSASLIDSIFCEKGHICLKKGVSPKEFLS